MGIKYLYDNFKQSFENIFWKNKILIKLVIREENLLIMYIAKF